MTLPDDSSTATTGEEPLPEAALESIAGGGIGDTHWYCKTHPTWKGALTQSCTGTAPHEYYAGGVTVPLG